MESLTSSLKDSLTDESEKRDKVVLPKEEQLKLNAMTRFDKRVDEEAEKAKFNRQISMQLGRINEHEAPQTMTIKEMEKKKEKIEEKQLGLGRFDQGIINFIVDDDESAILKQKRTAFEKPKAKIKPPGAFDYLTQRDKVVVGNPGDPFNAIHDDTEIDQCKVMHQLQYMEDRTTGFQMAIDEKMNNMDDLRKLLADSKLISEPIVEEGREFDPNKNQFFVPIQNIDYAEVEWDQIQHTSLGRRLTAYFDQLKADRRILALQINALQNDQEVALAQQAENLK